MPLPSRQSRAVTACVGVLLAALLAGAWGFGVEPDWIEVTRHHVAAPVDPPLRIAHLTDLHVRRVGRREEILLAHLAREKPDAIVITGAAWWRGTSSSPSASAATPSSTLGPASS